MIQPDSLASGDLRVRAGRLHTRLLLIGVWGLAQFLSLGAIAQQPSGGGVAYAAHVGGFIFGTVVARWFARAGER
jgi:membrane associated rhomboid family serine protease